MELHGKVAIVTGSGGEGCGRAIACRLAREGARLVVSDINEAGGLATVRQIERNGGRAAFFPTDIRVEDQVHSLVKFAEQTFGSLSVLINNASAPFRPAEPLEHWADMVQTDLLGSMYATRFTIDAMRSSGGGAIVNITSITALWHGRDVPAPGYDAAKAGLLRLTTASSGLREKENIRVNCLAPGWIASPEVKTYWDALSPTQRKDRGAPSKLLELDEVAGAVVHLATDESLAGRVLVWWSENAPGLIPFGDRGYEALTEVSW